MKNTNAVSRWNKAKALIIDEVSMLDPGMFDKMEYVARRIRQENDARFANMPFGGIQVFILLRFD